MMSNEQQSSKKIYQNPVIKKKTWFCVKCEKTFATNYSLRRHIGIVHKAPRTLIEKVDDGVMHGTPVYDANP